MRSGRSLKFAAALTVAALHLHANAGAREQPATDAEREQAGDTYIGCQIEKARRLDDGLSDAMTIGRAIAASCRTEMENLARVLAKGEKRDRVRLLVIDRLASHAAQDASVVVLLERKRRTDPGMRQ